jgi:enoyl-CoA hydratase
MRENPSLIAPAGFVNPGIRRMWPNKNSVPATGSELRGFCAYVSGKQELTVDTYISILTETRGRVGLVRLNRPKTLNALNSALIAELMDALAAFDAEATTGAIVITGDERAFAAGADIKEMAGASAVEMLQRDQISSFDSILKIKKPVIAAVSGWCLGGGNELAMSCDMIVASESARFGQPEINLGVIPGAGGTQRLTRAVGKAVAMEMVLNNRTLTAAEALQYGLVNRVVPVERYLEEALQLAGEIAGRAPLAVRLGKEAVNHAFESFLADGLADERRAFYFLFASADQKEGMQAFVEKRPPAWQGE